jgi:type II secretory pathway component PulF
MLTYKYTARDPATGQKVKSEVQAENEQSAAKLIRKEGLAPVDIILSDSERKGVGKLFNRVKIKDRVLFSRQLSTLLNAGLPLVQSLRSVADQTDSKPLKVVGSKVIGEVEAGATLSSALSKHPRVFNQVL